MSNTLVVKVFLVSPDTTIRKLSNLLTRDLGYLRVPLKRAFQKQQQVSFLAFKRRNANPPDWVNFVKLYLNNEREFQSFRRYDFVGLISKKKQGVARTLLVCFGSAYFHVARFIDPMFGVSILERVFDQDTNKIESVSEKGIVGDVMASTRFYRNARPLAYEDDFGKYFQRISVRLKKDQIATHFPLLAHRQGAKMKALLTVTGASSVEVRTKIDFFTFIQFAADITALLSTPAKPTFNKSLTPVSKDPQLVQELRRRLLEDLATFAADPAHEVDFDFCHRNYEDYFRSNIVRVEVPALMRNANSSSGGNFEYDDPLAMTEFQFLRDVYAELIASGSPPLDQAALAKVLEDVHISTGNEDEATMTEGTLFDYVQAELLVNGVSYFLLDHQWYSLGQSFDSSLIEKYQGRVRQHIVSHAFLQQWTALDKDETAYNEHYDKKGNPLYLHKITVDNVELCDILYADTARKELFIIHVKNGLGASVRDLASQIFMSARIVEGELKSGSPAQLRQLYRKALKLKRVNSAFLTEKQFLDQFLNYRRHYVVAIHAKTGLIGAEFAAGKFKSRIAKFALVELAGAMRANEYEFSVSLI